MIQVWLFLNQKFENSETMMGPIVAAFRQAAEKHLFPEPPPELGELSLHISTRLEMICRLVDHLNRRVADLRVIAKGHTQAHVFTPNTKGRALEVSRDCFYDLLIYFDALLVEVTAATDLLKRLLCLTQQHVRQPIPSKKLSKKLQDILSTAGCDLQWFASLDKHRNFFVHEGAPYIALHVDVEPYEILIAKENVQNFDNPESFLRLEELNQIMQGFRQSLPEFQKYLIALLH